LTNLSGDGILLELLHKRNELQELENVAIRVADGVLERVQRQGAVVEGQPPEVFSFGLAEQIRRRFSSICSRPFRRRQVSEKTRKTTENDASKKTKKKGKKNNRSPRYVIPGADYEKTGHSVSRGRTEHGLMTGKCKILKLLREESWF
jgi:hypothetical protein